MSAEPAKAINGDTFLEVQNVTKTFGRFVALENVSIEVFPGELVCILGPSGCGKTTLLRVIAGLEEQNVGQVFLKGTDISRMPTSQRECGIVFQSYALFPNLTATQNVAYGLKSSKFEKEKWRMKKYYCDVYAKISSPRKSKARFTPSPVFAEVSINLRPSFSANFFPSSVDTVSAPSSRRSILFAKRTTGTLVSRPEFSCKSVNHCSILLKVCRRVTS